MKYVFAKLHALHLTNNFVRHSNKTRMSQIDLTRRNLKIAFSFDFLHNFEFENMTTHTKFSNIPKNAIPLSINQSVICLKFMQASDEKFIFLVI